MALKGYLIDVFLNGKKHLQRNDLQTLLWMVNFIPKMAEITKQTGAFWALHIVLLLYIYGLGCLVYQIKFAEGPGDFIKSYVNVSIFTLTMNSSSWFLMKWPFCKNVLKKSKCPKDELSRQSEFFKTRHSNLMSVIKKILLFFFISNMINVLFIYLPNRADLQNDNYSMTQCVGLEPLSTSPNREVCQTIILTLELSLVTIVLNYQGVLLLLIAHTTAMYQLMADEMTALNDDDNEMVKEKLPTMILRHSMTLGTLHDLKLLYSVPIGVHFGMNVVCICLFFYLPLQDWITFVPVLMYCFFVYFLYCFLCQRLINASEVFERAVYCCGWEKFDLNEMRLTYIMLMQAQKPIELLAAGIVPVNIYTFATSMQAMFKFVTVVKF